MASEYTMKQAMRDTQIVTLASVLEIIEELPPAMAKKRILNLYEELRAEDGIR